MSMTLFGILWSEPNLLTSTSLLPNLLGVAHSLNTRWQGYVETDLNDGCTQVDKDYFDLLQNNNYELLP